jgi:DNA-binding transcriptional ArsR family regulator
LQANADEKASLDRAYGEPARRQALLQDYESLQILAKNFAGRSFNLDNANDRYSLKVSMLSSLRPPALKVLEELAKAYHDQFARPLPVSSLVRPEQYQHALRKVNRNAVLIDTPPHSTGLAFDIDYRYMSGAEQNFLMKELARLKDAGAIEVLRERNANYHVFVFVDGKRPSDELITASLEEAGAPPVEEAHHATKPSAQPALKPRIRGSSPRVSKGSKVKRLRRISRQRKDKHADYARHPR